MEGVNGTEGRREEASVEGSDSVFIESVGRRFVRRRLDVGGRREGEGDPLRERESPIGTVRVGGRNEGESPLTPLTDMPLRSVNSLFTHCCLSELSGCAAVRRGSDSVVVGKIGGEGGQVW